MENTSAAGAAAAPKPQVIQPGLDQPTATTRSRDPHIDVLRGVGMIIVIMAHMRTQEFLGYSFLAYIMLFVMPLFFFISGYLQPSPAQKKISFGKFVKHKALTLLLPYAIFFAVSLLWMNTVYASATGNPFFSFDNDPARLFRALFLAGEYLYGYATVPFPIWFLHALFFTSLIFFFVIKIRHKAVLALIAAALIFATGPIQSELAESPVWLLSMLPVNLFYMIFGYLFKDIVKWPAFTNKRKSDPVVALFFVLGLAAAGFFCMQNGRGNIWEIDRTISQYSVYWHYLGCVCGILSCWIASRFVTSKFLQFIGVNSLFFLALHPLILELPFVEGLPAYFLGRGFDGVAVYTLYFIVSFLLITVFVLIALGVKKLFVHMFTTRERREKKKTKPKPDAAAA